MMFEAFGAISWISGEQLAKIILIILIAIGVQMFVRATIDRFVRRVVRTHKHPSKLEAEKREKTLAEIFRTLTAVLIWTVVAVLILAQLNVNITALLTGAGVVGIVIGLGAQSSIKDFLAGIYIIAENQYRVGDIVTLHTGAGEMSGIVEDVTVRITKMRDMDGILHIIPNGSTTVVSNRTFHHANVQIDIYVDYSADIDKVEQVVNQVGDEMAENERWKENIIEPIHFLRVNDFNQMGVQVKILGQVAPATQWEVAGEFRRRLKKAFERHHIEIPLQQIIVHQAKNKR